MPLDDVDHVRLLIGDTDVDNALLSDEEIQACLDYRQIENADEEWVANIPAAAADAAVCVAAKFARKFNFAEDGQRFDVAQQHSHYLALGERLRRRAGGIAVPDSTSP